MNQRPRLRADIAEGARKVLILSVGLPIQTPFKLEDQVQHLQKSDSKVQYGQSEIAFAFCHLLGFNLMPRIKAIFLTSIQISMGYVYVKIFFKTNSLMPIIILNTLIDTL